MEASPCSEPLTLDISTLSTSTSSDSDDTSQLSPVTSDISCDNLSPMVHTSGSASTSGSSILDTPRKVLPSNLSPDEILKRLMSTVNDLKSIPDVSEESGPEIQIDHNPQPIDLTREYTEVAAIIEASNGIKSRVGRKEGSKAASPASRLWQNTLRATHVQRERPARARDGRAY